MPRPSSDSSLPTFDADGAPRFDVNEDASVYYGSDYWNDLEQVRSWLNEKVSGDPDRYWAEHFRATTGRTFKRALILNCGNGNVEHGLRTNGIIEESIGIDYSHELLDRAREVATDESLPFRYEWMDVNTASFPDDEFDLVVNHAAAHHIARIDKVFRELCRRLPEDGYFVSHDYVGPHRNQYTWDMWDAASTFNRTLPDRFRQDLRYPHLVTMLKDDPTEAIHSELILETMRRYFTIDELVPLGGAIAYQLLTHNRKIFAAADDDAERHDVVQKILVADDEFTTAHPDLTLLAYIVARPDKSALDDDARLDEWSRAEDEREARGAANNGEYYEYTTLQELALSAEAWEATAHRIQGWAEGVKSRYDRIMALPPYRQIKWAAKTRAGERVREERRKRRQHDGD